MSSINTDDDATESSSDEDDAPAPKRCRLNPIKLSYREYSSPFYRHVLTSASSRYPGLTPTNFDKSVLQAAAKARNIPLFNGRRALTSAQLASRLGVRLPRKTSEVRAEIEEVAKAKGIKVRKAGRKILAEKLDLKQGVSGKVVTHAIGR